MNTPICPAPWDPDAEEHWTADPLAGLDESAHERDGRAWEALLAAAFALDGCEPDGLFGRLRGLRCLGARLRGERLVPPIEMDFEEQDDVLRSHRGGLLGLLRKVA